MRAIRESMPAPLPAQIPGALSHIVARLLEKEPSRRFPDALTLAAALEEAQPRRGPVEEGLGLDAERR
jgi:serine/threonine-protein kinase